MFSRVRIAIRFFFMGLAVGVLLAPRSGQETRRMVRERADRLLNDLLDAATLGAFDSGADTDEGTGQTATRSTNGRSRKASGTATSAASGAA
ncbi:MAG TPA: YtxH domain-containing protein [Candidatus Limnocylindria bacterium]|nr:YtxH domain-containing protein [Candidatus Limnocylindria bacterium]